MGLLDVARRWFGEFCEEDTVIALKDMDSLQACLLNCCSHESMIVARQFQQTLKDMKRQDVRIGAYTNGFVTVYGDSTSKNEYRDLSPADYLAQANIWIQLGATIVGGCCGVFPEHMQAIANEIKKHEGASSDFGRV